jgi:hypothetical protein
MFSLVFSLNAIRRESRVVASNYILAGESKKIILETFCGKKLLKK